MSVGSPPWICALDSIKFQCILMIAFKTAFQTNACHFEFRVMSFRLIDDPHSFHRAMNSTLAPLLIKCQ
jgi:hypothetical protein